MGATQAWDLNHSDGGMLKLDSFLDILSPYFIPRESKGTPMPRPPKKQGLIKEVINHYCPLVP